MAGNVITYSGLITKTRAMRKNLLDREKLQQLTEAATVNEAVSLLKTVNGYRDAYRKEEGEWHRGQAEAMIRQVLWNDFEKLYHFSNSSQREALELVFIRYETDFLKECLKHLYQQEFSPLGERGDFFRRHTCFSMDQAASVSTMQELLQCLKGTGYEQALLQIQQQDAGYAQYAFGLDMHYYISIYGRIRRMKNSSQKELLLHLYGTRIDWLNIMWIYRSKRFFTQRETDIYAMLIPVRYRLKRQELSRMVEAEELETFEHTLKSTAYFKGKDALLRMEDEISYRQVMEKTYHQLVQKYPMSMAPVLHYLYDREQEQERITSVIEGIRYQIPPREIREYILL